MNLRKFSIGMFAVAVLVSNAAVVAKEDKKPRLKFRSNGPTCMCVGGLSEKDIRRAEKSRKNTDERESDQGFELIDGNNQNSAVKEKETNNGSQDTKGSSKHP